MWRAWHRLHLDRPHYGGGMGSTVPGRISWRDVREWADYHDMTADEFDFLDHCIRAMDGDYLEWSAARARAASGGKI